MLVVSNWKAYVNDLSKAKALVAAGKRAVAKGAVQLVIAPSAPYLGMFASGRLPKNFSFAAQDISLSTDGAATGEMTGAVLAEFRLTHVIVGHSERRAIGETNDMVRAKVERALAAGLTPILCIGEHEHDPEAKYLLFLRTQLAAVFEGISAKDRSRIVIAYEPIWAIGKGVADSIKPSDLREIVLYIQKILATYLPSASVKKVPILYGGSVEPTNIRALAMEGRVQGFLVGHASAEVGTYSGLLKALS